MSGWSTAPRSCRSCGTFWENHDSTRLNRHGNDVGTQYRSAVWTTTPAQAAAARRIRDLFQGELTRMGLGTCVTTIGPADELYADFGGPFYLAEDYHQGYLHKNPGGYCNHGPNIRIATLPSEILSKYSDHNIESPADSCRLTKR